MTAILHPKCGKRFPNGNRAGHCAGCCETFIGLTSFEAHRVGTHTPDTRHCEIKPYINYRSEYPHTLIFGHWQDERGYWHYGEKLSEEQKAERWPVKDDQ